MKKPLEVLRLYPDHDYTLNGALASRASRDLSRPFMLFRDRSWSRGEFMNTADAAARMLAARGIRRGDRVGVMARNYDGHPVMLFALGRLGSIMVPVNPEFRVEEAKSRTGVRSPRLRPSPFRSLSYRGRPGLPPSSPFSSTFFPLFLNETVA